MIRKYLGLGETVTSLEAEKVELKSKKHDVGANVFRLSSKHVINSGKTAFEKKLSDKNNYLAAMWPQVTSKQACLSRFNRLTTPIRVNLRLEKIERGS